MRKETLKTNCARILPGLAMLLLILGASCLRQYPQFVVIRVEKDIGEAEEGIYAGTYGNDAGYQTIVSDTTPGEYFTELNALSDEVFCIILRTDGGHIRVEMYVEGELVRQGSTREEGDQIELEYSP
jgi:hypothetical protein